VLTALSIRVCRPCWQRTLPCNVFCQHRPWTRVLGTHYPCPRAVFTVSKMTPVFTGRAAVDTVVIVDTHIYGSWTRVLFLSCPRPVNTGSVYRAFVYFLRSKLFSSLDNSCRLIQYTLYSVSTKKRPPKYNGVVFEILDKHH